MALRLAVVVMRNVEIDVGSWQGRTGAGSEDGASRSHTVTETIAI